MIRKIWLGLSLVAFTCAGAAIAQPSGIKRTPLQKLEFPAGYNTITAIAEVLAGGSAGRGFDSSIATPAGSVRSAEDRDPDIRDCTHVVVLELNGQRRADGQAV